MQEKLVSRAKELLSDGTRAFPSLPTTDSAAQTLANT